MNPNSEDAAPDAGAPDRVRRPALSSRRGLGGRLSRRGASIAAGALLLSVAAVAGTLTIREVQNGAPALDPAPQPMVGVGATPPRTDPLWPAIDQWDRLRQTHTLPFDGYAGFLIAHRGWPGETAMRRDAEKALQPGQDAARVAAFFTALPPLTGAGRTRYAEALATLGRTAEAQAAAVAAWTGGALSPDDEAFLLGRFGSTFQPADQDKRMERLLWDRATASVQRQIGAVSAERRPIYAARLALQTRAADAAEQAVALGAGATRDPGFVVDRAVWLRDTAQLPVARAFLAETRTLDGAPFDPQKWLEVLLSFQKGAAADGQYDLAYRIALSADAAILPGRPLREAALALRDPYTTIVWTAGWTALRQLQRYKDAEAMFARYAAGAATPGSQAKGDYWAGRAAERAGDKPAADAHYASAARQIDQFYGQLATERLGRTIALPADPPAVAIAPAMRTAFDAREIVRAARLLGQQRQFLLQTQFVRAIGLAAQSDADHVLADQLSKELDRPDLAVIVSRQARPSGLRDPIRLGFPTMPVPPAMATHWTMIHSLSRQETNFDRAAVSAVGARGLMQLMPATAREQAGKLGLPYDAARLTEDPGYNVTLGSAYFDRMMTYYGNSYVLAVASYNAGAGNVNRFVRANGDPRLPGVDVVDWIEAIPFSETRTYVQKVLENAVVYDLLNPARAKTPEKDRLSHYLAKKVGG